MTWVDALGLTAQLGGARAVKTGSKLATEARAQETSH